MKDETISIDVYSAAFFLSDYFSKWMEKKSKMDVVSLINGAITVTIPVEKCIQFAKNEETMDT